MGVVLSAERETSRRARGGFLVGSGKGQCAGVGVIVQGRSFALHVAQSESFEDGV